MVILPVCDALMPVRFFQVRSGRGAIDEDLQQQAQGYKEYSFPLGVNS